MAAFAPPACFVRVPLAAVAAQGRQRRLRRARRWLDVQGRWLGLTPPCPIALAFPAGVRLRLEPALTAIAVITTAFARTPALAVTA
jgi:hypothetical protein